jgi:predicted GNAT superfamily acetyltransferase
MPEPNSKPSVTIRSLRDYGELLQAIRVEKEVWQTEDFDLMPPTLAVATLAAGSLWLGAFDGPKLVGFAFGFHALEQGRRSIHSHLLAVLPEYREFDLGTRLKLAQRERALAARVPEITWTFDPLQSKNAHLNFTKLGVVSDSYKVDFYGPSTTSVLHQNSTDRLWVRWPVASKRVERRISGAGNRAEMLDALSTLPPLVHFNGNGKPARAELGEALMRQRIAIEIPGDIGAVETSDPALAKEWREATRWAFTEALKAGFFVAEFCRAVRGKQGPGVYLLEKGSLAEYVPELKNE